MICAGYSAIWALFRGYRSPSPAQPQKVLYGEKGRYCLEQRLHEGGHGEIWTATAQATGAEVVVKLGRPDTDLPASSFQLECDILVGELYGDPAIVRGLDVGSRRCGRVAFLVMERLGDSLAVPPQFFKWAVYLPILRSLLGALASLHQQGVVHHDVKPSNILVASTTPLTVKLCDFSPRRKLGCPSRVTA